ncbi:MAG: DDE-type integrase/transposase/recombinase [Trueperaceae bacterium]|nr:DDE-type integrase/transposase/recombinase [Trueperaceae bacterium]
MIALNDSCDHPLVYQSLLGHYLDQLSKRIVGYAMADHMRTGLVINCLNMAITHRKLPKGLIHHNDKGAQYTSYAFQRKLSAHGFQASFTAKGACLDNAVIEHP